MIRRVTQICWPLDDRDRALIGLLTLVSIGTAVRLAATGQPLRACTVVLIAVGWLLFAYRHSRTIEATVDIDPDGSLSGQIERTNRRARRGDADHALEISITNPNTNRS
jgi:hypothetical protein